jgi:hypothetical protein
MHFGQGVICTCKIMDLKGFSKLRGTTLRPIFHSLTLPLDLHLAIPRAYVSHALSDQTVDVYYSEALEVDLSAEVLKVAQVLNVEGRPNRGSWPEHLNPG